MRRIAILALTAGTIATLAPATADARSLSHAKAHGKAIKAVRALCRSMDTCTAWGVDRSCYRISRRTFECDFSIWNDDIAVRCDDTIRIYRIRYGVTFRYPYKADCVSEAPSEPLPPPPTTDDFGDGSGHIGLCRDGTLSDSIGRQGACSHHGGVA